jgi:acetylornithine deacetylase/succinyl-diaminopimelate desuccinylase-like protein
LNDATTKAKQIIEDHLDRGYLIETLSRLARIPTQVPLGTETYMEPDDPKLVHYVQEVVRPELVRQGEYDLLDVPRNNLVAQVGRGESGRSLLVMNYTPVQHNNLMEDPFSGKVASARAYGVDEPAVGRLYWAINNEGRSSHACSDAILDALPTKPDFGIVQLSTGLRISVGNRGRVDVLVHVEGKASHSSMPGFGHSAIEGAHEVITRLRKLEWSDAPHPLLGRRHVLVYKIRYWPLAPHTLPSDAYLTIDRRLIPGDDPEHATEEVRNAIGDLSPFRVTVERGPVMLPALVAVDNPWVAALQDAVRATRGKPADTVHGQGTFDAGGPCARGVPTVMFGSGGGVWPLGIDFVPVSAVETEAKTLALLILSQLS